MKSEQEHLEFHARLGFEWVVRPLERPRDPEVMVCRLYVQPAFLSGLLVTCTLAPAESRCDIVPLPVPERPLTRELQNLCRAQAISNPQEFCSRLANLSVWELEDCHTNSRDGIGFFHVTAKASEVHAITMHNPNLHEDPRYVDLVNLYSDTFLCSKFTMQHSWTPPLSDEEFRVAWAEKMKLIKRSNRWFYRILRWARPSEKR